MQSVTILPGRDKAGNPEPFQNITLDDADANALGELADKGVDIVFQTIPEDAPQGIEAILKKYRG